MLCAKPYRQGAEAYGCGQCMPCRINRKRLWVSRIMLEAMSHGDSVFVTLTYNPESIPHDWCVSKAVAQKFLKRLRKRLARSIRYFMVGEYGEKSTRPHYHAILFNVSDLDRAAIEASWPFGFVHIGTLTPESAGYCVAYISSARTQRKEIDRDEKLRGRTPEFSVMSRKPGIGSAAVGTFAASLGGQSGVKFGESARDVPGSYRLGNRQFPIGRYLTGKLRLALGFDKTGEPDHLRKQRADQRWLDAYKQTTAVFLKKDAIKRQQSDRKASALVKIQQSKGSKI